MKKLFGIVFLLLVSFLLVGCGGSPVPSLVPGSGRHVLRHRGRQAHIRRARAEHLQSGDGSLCAAPRLVPRADDRLDSAVSRELREAWVQREP